MATDLGDPIDVGALPVVSDEDVRAIYPVEQRAAEGAVQAAFVSGQVAMHRKAHDVAAHAAQQSDMLRATGSYLDEHAASRGFQRAEGETQEGFRARLLRDPELASRLALVRAIDTLLARFTDARCQISESILDRWFVHSTTTTGSEDPPSWLSFVGANPNYPDRLYPDSGEPQIRESSMPGGARAFRNVSGRMLVIRIPDLAALDGLRGFTRLTTDNEETGFFVTDDGEEAIGTFLAKDTVSAISVYNAIANVVRATKGQSVRWTIFIDSRLNTAT